MHATHWLISTQVATFAEQARWHGRSEFLGDVLDWGFPLMALPSLYGAARFEEHAHAVGFERGASRGYVVLALMQVAWGVLSTQKLWWLQILAVAVFVPARLLGFVHLYTCVGAFFPAEHFGIMAGACLTLGGLCAIPASQALRAWLVASMDPRGPNGALAAALVVLDALAGAASRIVKIDRPDVVAAPTTRRRWSSRSSSPNTAMGATRPRRLSFPTGRPRPRRGVRCGSTTSPRRLL